MTDCNLNAQRPPLKPADAYRSRLGAQREPLSKTALSEMRAWQEASAQTGRRDAS